MYEICQANGQLFCSFSSQEEASMDKDQQQINRIYLEYSKLLSTISQVRHKCLDIKDDELGTYFVTFRKDMHTVDSMILDALKASFEDVTNIKGHFLAYHVFYPHLKWQKFNAIYPKVVLACYARLRELTPGLLQ